MAIDTVKVTVNGTTVNAVSNGDGTYFHTIDLTDAAYDYATYGVKIYIDYIAANTAKPVGACYVSDIGYSKKPQLTDKNIWVKMSDNCAEAVYTENKGWKVTAATEKHYYIKLNHEVTAYYMEQGCDQMTITFCDTFDGATYEGTPLNCRIWILPPKAANGGKKPMHMLPSAERARPAPIII